MGGMTSLHFTEYDTRLAAYALIVDDADRILLSWFNGATPGWTLPGGGVDFEESIEDAIVREVREETGLTIEPGGAMATYFVPEMRHIDVIFRVHCETKPHVEVASEALESGWFALDELPHPDKSTRRIQRAVRLARRPAQVGRVVGGAGASDGPANAGAGSAQQA